MRSIRSLFVLFLVLALVAAGCGGSDDTDDATPGDSTAATTVAPTTTKPEPVPGELTLVVDGVEGEEDKLFVALVGPDDAISDDLKRALETGQVPGEGEDTSILLAFPAAFCDEVADVLVDNQFEIRAMGAEGNPCIPPGAEGDPDVDDRDYPAYEFDPGDTWVFVGTFVAGERVAGRCASAGVSIDGDTTAALTLAPCSGS